VIVSVTDTMPQTSYVRKRRLRHFGHSGVIYCDSSKRSGAVGQILSKQSTAMMMGNQNANLPSQAQARVLDGDSGSAGRCSPIHLPPTRLSREARGNGAACTATPGSSIPSAR
jgi:hypothetical protein